MIIPTDTFLKPSLQTRYIRKEKLDYYDYNLYRNIKPSGQSCVPHALNAIEGMWIESCMSSLAVNGVLGIRSTSFGR